MVDLTISKDDVIELDTIIKKSNIASDPISYNESAFDNSGIQTHTSILDPQKTGTYDIDVNGQTFTVKVTDPSTIPDNGVAKYAFEQDVTDSWNDNSLTDNTSAGYVTGKVGSYAKDFDSSQNDYCSMKPPVFDGSASGYSVAVWVNWDTVGGLYTGRWDGTNQFHFGKPFSSFDWHTYDGSYQGFNNKDLGITANTDTWYHVVGVWDGADYIVYVDGTERARTASSTFALPTDEWYVGARLHDGGPRLEIDGQLDDLRFYDKGLTKTEVNNLKDTGSI